MSGNKTWLSLYEQRRTLSRSDHPLSANSGCTLRIQWTQVHPLTAFDSGAHRSHAIKVVLRTSLRS